MRVFAPFIAVMAVLAAAQQTSEFPDKTGVRSLWIPFKTLDGTPLASIASNNSDVTVYVVSCPTASPACAIAPNLTLTEGPSTVEYVSTVTNSGGVATLGCTLDGTTSAVCSNLARNGGNVAKDTSTLGASQIKYQAISITQTINNTATLPVTVTVTPSSTSTSSSSSSGAANPTAAAPWTLGGAVGAGLLALAAL
ncbi:Hypothetical protein R9X50_00027600 [Acrodontium crateriforme]|uniref:GPI anchored protein n=1 Tax=Acrodontium crateriforme TaxID=150365 RepID=A0AAQ3LYI6_9PEZI|nr:Hypothetical protein R9X50_00027600 [Acrodontium crateriforme]